MMLLKNKCFIFGATALILVSCGGGGGSTPMEMEQTNSATDSTWTIDSFAYTGNPNTTIDTTSNADPTNIGITVVSTTEPNATNAAYSGSVLSLQYTLNGAGTYTSVNSAEALVQSNSVNPSLNVVFIEASAGTLNVSPFATTAWTSTVGTIAVEVDSNDRYHFSSTEALPLTRSVDLGTGIPGSPNDVNLSMRNIYAR